MESHSVWQYLAPADRETFISGTICWLMDPKGDHGLGKKLLSLLLKKLKLSAKTNSELTVKPEVTEGRDKRFDISVYENREQIAIFEVKCKTFGSRNQIKKGSLWIAGSCSQNAFNEAFKERFAPFSHVMHEFKKAQI